MLDLVPVRSDQTTTDALRVTVSLARTAEREGYHRYWLAEHHNMPAVAATNPPVLIAMVAGATERIRVGSGGVMLPNHAPLVVAEQFALLEAAHPGRIDLGIGRAPGTDPVTRWVLRNGATEEDAVARFPEYVQNVAALMAELADQAEVFLVEAEAGALRVGQSLNEKGPRVMPGLVVFSAWITQADDQLYGSHDGGPLLKGWRVMDYSAAPSSPSSFTTREAWMLATARSLP